MVGDGDVSRDKHDTGPGAVRLPPALIPPLPLSHAPASNSGGDYDQRHKPRGLL